MKLSKSCLFVFAILCMLKKCLLLSIVCITSIIQCIHPLSLTVCFSRLLHHHHHQRLLTFNLLDLLQILESNCTLPSLFIADRIMISQENSKKEPLAAAVVTTVPKLIRVVAPTNLPGGYQMEVQTDNDPPITFTATVVRTYMHKAKHPWIYNF